MRHIHSQNNIIITGKVTSSRLTFQELHSVYCCIPSVLTGPYRHSRVNVRPPIDHTVSILAHNNTSLHLCMTLCEHINHVSKVQCSVCSKVTLIGFYYGLYDAEYKGKKDNGLSKQRSSWLNKSILVSVHWHVCSIL